MKITNHPVNNLSITSQTSPAPAGAPADTAADAVTGPGSAYAPSSELKKLLDLVRKEPEVRLDRVEEVIHRIQHGDYLTQATDEKVAERWLGQD